MCLELRKKMQKIIKKKSIGEIGTTQLTFTCSKLTVKTPERRHWRRSVVFTVNFEYILHVFLVLLLLTLNKYMLV